jgi:hypothetical protein
VRRSINPAAMQVGQKPGGSGVLSALGDIRCPYQPPSFPQVGQKRGETMESDGNKLDWLSFAQRHGATLNKKGGYYHRGKQYEMEKKLAVAKTYLHYKQLGGVRPSLSKIASEHKVDRWFVRKIESELYLNDGCVVFLEEVTLDMVSRRWLGPGSIVVDQADCFALYCLFRRKPTRPVSSYVHKLYPHRGTIMSKSIVLKFFNHAFKICGGLCVPKFCSL